MAEDEAVSPSVMPKDVIIFVEDREGRRHRLVAPTDMGLNLMELCKAAGLPVEGVCGGMGLCASCQCYVVSDHPLPAKNLNEENMLSEAFFVQENSRLGCQILVSPELDGLEIVLAPEAEA